MTSKTSKKARVYCFNEFGGPEKLYLHEDEVSLPSIGHVRVHVQAMSLNQADSLFLANKYIEQPSLPSKLGYEIAGVIDAVAEDVQELRVGERVSSIPTFSVKDYGNFGELVVLPVRALMRTPPRLDIREAASFTFAYFTDYFGLFELGRMEPFQTVLVTAASSTTGLAAISMARAAGCTVIATSRSRNKKEALEKAGAHHVVATAEENLAERVHDLTEGRGVDIVYDCVAGTLSEAIIGCIRPFGRWIVYGLMDTTPFPFPWFSLLAGTIKLDLYKIFDFTGHRHLKLPSNDQALMKAIEYVSAGVQSGVLSVVVDKVFQGLESLPEALTYQKSGAGSGKIVIEL